MVGVLNLRTIQHGKPKMALYKTIETIKYYLSSKIHVYAYQILVPVILLILQAEKMRGLMKQEAGFALY